MASATLPAPRMGTNRCGFDLSQDQLGNSRTSEVLTSSIPHVCAPHCYLWASDTERAS
jgi:hypothetical protein